MTSEINKVLDERPSKVPKALVPILVVIFMAGLVDGLDAQLVTVQLPTLCEKLNITMSNGSWIVLGYMLGIASLMIPCGKMAKNGRVKRFFTIGLMLMAVGSIASAMCVISGNFWIMIIFRIIQGVGAAMFFAALPCIIVRYLPQDMKGTGMAAMGASSGVQLIIAPLVGGVIAHFYCPAVFFLTPIIGIALVLLQAKVLPADEQGDKTRDPTLMGAVAAMLCIGSLLMILENIGNNGIAQYAIYGCAAVIVVSLIVLYKSILKDSDRAIISPRMLRNRDYILVSLAFFVCTIMLAGTQYILPFFLQISFGFESWKSGIFLAIASVTLIIIVMPVGRMVDKRGGKSSAIAAQSFRMCVAFILFLLSWNLFGGTMAICVLVFMLVIYGMSHAFSGTGQLTRAIHHATKGYEDESTNFVLTLNYAAQALGTVIYALVISVTVPGTIGLNIQDFTKELMDAAVHNTAVVGIILCIIGLCLTLQVKNLIPKHEETKEEQSGDQEESES